MPVAKYNITPVPKPRQVRGDKWKKRPAVLRYRAFADECRLKGVALPLAGAGIQFVLPMPKSWSEKKKEEYDGTPHMGKPDLSNLLKALEDAAMAMDSYSWVEKLAEAGYRIKVDEHGLRGWKD